MWSLKDEDRKIIERCLRADEKAFGELLAKYRATIYTLCLRMVRNAAAAEDIAQETFVRAFSALASYNLELPFSCWLNKIASNLCIDHLRREKYRTVSIEEPIAGREDDLALQLPDMAAGPEREVESKEMFAILEEALALLPEHHRIVIVLRHQEQLSYEEIGRTLDIPLGTVKARIHRARSFIVEYFRKKGFMPEDLGIGGE